MTRCQAIPCPGFAENAWLMHELSLAMEVIDLVSQEAENNRLGMIREITIEVGSLSGVEADAFEWALDLAVKDSILENAVKRILRTPGTGLCSFCDTKFVMNHILDTCPECKNYPKEIQGGREFRLVSITGE